MESTQTTETCRTRFHRVAVWVHIHAHVIEGALQGWVI